MAFSKVERWNANWKSLFPRKTQVCLHLVMGQHHSTSNGRHLRFRLRMLWVCWHWRTAATYLCTSGLSHSATKSCDSPLVFCLRFENVWDTSNIFCSPISFQFLYGLISSILSCYFLCLYMFISSSSAGCFFGQGSRYLSHTMTLVAPVSTGWMASEAGARAEKIKTTVDSM